RLIKTSLWLLLAGAVLSALLVAGVLHWAAPLDGATLHINGEQFTFTQLQGGEWLLAIGAVLLALVVVLLIVPFALIVPLLCAALGIAVALCVLLGVAALLLSPLLLLAWIVWRLARSPSAARGSGATMGA
ncbi:MAG: hypothetical protein U1B84_27335, partial [Variovorax sp.]|nr:hypothetical protein [Variovorax sp.]